MVVVMLCPEAVGPSGSRGLLMEVHLQSFLTFRTRRRCLRHTRQLYFWYRRLSVCHRACIGAAANEGISTVAGSQTPNYFRSSKPYPSHHSKWRLSYPAGLEMCEDAWASTLK